jgi:hypothetical protein
MSKRWILAACLIASGQLNASELDNLVNSSNALRQQFSNGIIAVGGMINVAQDGGIPSNELLANKDAYITAEVQNAYNQAIAQMQAASFTNMGAQEFFDQQAADQMSLLDQAVDSYVAAAGALIEGATLANMAENLQGGSDDAGALEVQNYINQNQDTVVLTDEEVETYNQSLDNVVSIAQAASSFYAVANDETLIAEADEAAAAYTLSYTEAGDAFFDSTTGIVSVAFSTQELTVSLDVNNYFMQDVDIMSVGAESMFYYTSPEGGCWFAADMYACLEELGVYGP